jgi:hypothetical protein
LIRIDAQQIETEAIAPPPFPCSTSTSPSIRISVPPVAPICRAASVRQTLADGRISGARLTISTLIAAGAPVEVGGGT